MRVVVFFTVAAALGLSAVSRPARAAGTNLVYTYGGPFDLRIPADPDATDGWMADAVILVPDHLLICDVDVSVSISHSAAFDLLLAIRNPGDTGVVLNQGNPLEGYFDGADYKATIFDDEAKIRIEDAAPPFTGRYRPKGKLAVFDGKDAYGLWKLRILDAYERDSGYLEFFRLTITTAAAKPAAVNPVPGAGGLVLLGLALLGPGRRTLVPVRR